MLSDFSSIDLAASLSASSESWQHRPIAAFSINSLKALNETKKALPATCPYCY
jgi:hypothetical protein